MATPDLTSILENLSRSLIPVQSLITGFGYLLGIGLVISGLKKLAEVGGQSRQKISLALAYIVAGCIMVFLPTSLQVASNTFFGNSNALQYTPFSTYTLYGAVVVLIKTAGLVWFLRGIVLILHAAEPGKQDGPKGLFFLLAGIFAVNFQYTVEWIDEVFVYLLQSI